MTRTKNAQASKPSIRPLAAPVPRASGSRPHGFPDAATITLLVLVDLAHSYCVEGHGLHLAAAAVVAVVTIAAAWQACCGSGAPCLPCAAPQQLTV